MYLASGEKDLTEPGRRNESRDGPTHPKSLGGRRLRKGQVSGNLLTSGAHAFDLCSPILGVYSPGSVMGMVLSIHTVAYNHF